MANRSIDDEPMNIEIRIPIAKSRTGERYYKRYREKARAMQKVAKKLK